MRRTSILVIIGSIIIQVASPPPPKPRRVSPQSGSPPSSRPRFTPGGTQGTGAPGKSSSTQQHGGAENPEVATRELQHGVPVGPTRGGGGPSGHSGQRPPPKPYGGGGQSGRGGGRGPGRDGGRGGQGKPDGKRAAAAKRLCRYGYCDNPPNISMSEETIAKAIKGFQRYYGLNKTGELDEGTMEMMERPRCANKDVDSNGRMRRQVQRQVWRDRQLTWCLVNIPGNRSAYPWTKLEIRETLSGTIKMWTDISDLSITELLGACTADITYTFILEKDDLRTGVGGTLAWAYLPEIGKIYFDDHENWKKVSNEHTYDGVYGVYLGWTAVHEMGHALGLEHSPNSESVMYAIYPRDPRKIQNLKLHAEDIFSIQTLYPGPKTPGPATEEPTTIPTSVQTPTPIPTLSPSTPMGPMTRSPASSSTSPFPCSVIIDASFRWYDAAFFIIVGNEVTLRQPNVFQPPTMSADTSNVFPKFSGRMDACFSIANYVFILQVDMVYEYVSITKKHMRGLFVHFKFKRKDRISAKWGLHMSSIDAAVYDPSRRSVYFLKGSQAYRIQYLSYQKWGQPSIMNIAQLRMFTNLPPDWVRDVDALTSISDNSFIMFKGSQFVRVSGGFIRKGQLTDLNIDCQFVGGEQEGHKQESHEEGEKEEGENEENDEDSSETGGEGRVREGHDEEEGGDIEDEREEDGQRDHKPGRIPPRRPPGKRPRRPPGNRKRGR